MLLTSVYHMLKYDSPFDANLYNDHYHKAVSKFSNVSVKKLIAFLSEKGFSVIDTQSGEVFGSSG